MKFNPFRFRRNGRFVRDEIERNAAMEEIALVDSWDPFGPDPDECDGYSCWLCNPSPLDWDFRFVELRATIAELAA